MASHKEIIMFICYADNMLSDEEFLVLWQILAYNNNNNFISVCPRLIGHGITYYSKKHSIRFIYTKNEKSELKTHI